MIKIHGVIGSFKDEKGKLIKGVELVDVIAQVASHGDQIDLVFEFTSPGGLLDVGYAIRDYMLDLIKEGKNITTIANQLVGSIATAPYLVGQKRQIVKGTDFVVHNPYATNITGDADQLQQYSKSLAEEEQNMAKYYSSVTGISSSTMDLLMKEDKPMNAQRAVELGFAHEVIEGTLNSEFKNLQVIACINTPSMEIKSIIQQGKDALKQLHKMVAKAKGEVKNLSVTTEDGKSLEIEGDTLEVGAMVSFEDQPTPSTQYVLADGTKFTTDADSKIESITEPEQVEAKMGDIVKDDKGEIVKSGESTLANGTKVKTNDKGEIISMEAPESAPESELQKENKELKEGMAEMKKTQEETQASIVALSKLMGSNFEAPTRNTVFAKSTEKKDDKDKGGNMKEEILENRKNRNKKNDE